MIRFNVLTPLFFLKRRISILPQVPKRKLMATPILRQEKKQNNFEKKSEVNKETSSSRTYYNFLCKCRKGFNTFSEFLDHVKSSHQIENLNFQEILTKKSGSKWDIKFYWNLSCRCGHKFSSSLCSADLKVNKEQIELLKKYRLQCLKCKKYAKFDKEELLDKFLEERVKQKLVYSFYKKEFAKFKSETHSKKTLEGHKRELCEKCKLLGRYCGEELIYQQEQILITKK